MKPETKLKFDKAFKKFTTFIKVAEPKVAKFVTANKDNLFKIIRKIAKSNFENPAKRAAAIKEIGGLAGNLNFGESHLGLIVEGLVTLAKLFKLI